MVDMIDKIFFNARTHSSWLDLEVDHELLKKAFDMAILGPTSLNCQPLRTLFISSKEAKEKLSKVLYEGNIEKSETAPINVIFAYDLNFYEELPRLFPYLDFKSKFAANREMAENAAKLNADLQIGYFIIAMRAIGLDCGPMSGFDNKICDEIFFANTSFRSQLICNIGYGDKTKLYPRPLRYEFNEICKII